MDQDLFAGKTALVTGGASGIGKALCQELAWRGAVLYAADTNRPELEDAMNELNNEGCKAEGALLDVTDYAAVKELVDEIVARHGRLDYVFNNAGIVVVGRAEEFTWEDWHRVIDVDLYGVVNGVMAAYPVMVGQGHGHIVNTASAAGLFPSVYEISYTASKYGVVGLSNALRLEGAKRGVKVSVVCPGFIDTPIFSRMKTIGMDRERLVRLIPPKVPADRCARTILRGVERNRAVIPVGADAWLALLLQRLGLGASSLISKTQLWAYGRAVK